MANLAVDSIDAMQGTLKQLAIGHKTDMLLQNLDAHVRNALYHVEQSAEIVATANRLLRLANEFGQRHSGVIIGRQARDDRDRHLAVMNAVYLALRKLLEAAEPSAESLALGS